MKTIIFLFLSMAFLSCNSGDLTRANAKKQVIDTFEYPIADIKTMHYKDYHVAWRVTYKELVPFIEKGLITSNYRGKGLYGHLYTEPTKLGRKYLYSDTPDSKFDVIVSDLSFGEITGIKEYPEMNLAEVEYTLVRKNITPFGECMGKVEGEIIKKRVSFVKYDNGWRIGN